MEHRIRAAAIITDGARLLLVKHVHPETGDTWWVPPGGGLQDGESIIDCARREVWEETGLTVELGKVLYLREFVERDLHLHHFEVFLAGTSFSGVVTMANVAGRGEDERYIKEVRFLSPEEIPPLVVYPEILKGGFWVDLERGFPETRYLGVQLA